MSGKPVVLLGGMEAVEEEDKPPEQPIVERDPTGRWSRVDQILGRGAFKTVYKGFDEDEGIEVAWNQVRVSELVSTKEERDRLFAEIRVLKQLKHKNIMTFYDSWLDSKTMTVNFITELFTSGTLRQYRKKHKHIDPEVLKRWAWQILCGLVYLHGHTPSIIHRDLKSDNIFINGCEGVVKIGDLGLATMLRARTAPQSVLGTPEFMAPELYDEEYDDRVDVYSFGMCLLELATLEYPYAECRNAAQIYRKVSQGILPAGLAKVPTGELAEFISVCIAARHQRPRARHLLKHPYFHTIRAEKAAVKLGAEALAHSVSCAADLHQMVADCTASVAGSVSRTSSELAEVQQGLPSSSIDNGRTGPSAESRKPEPEQERLLEELEQQPLNMESQSQSMPLVEPSAWRPDPLLEKPEGLSPPHSEPGRQSFGDRDGAESWATVRTNRDSFETASTSHQHMQERSMSDCSDRDDRQPVLTGDRSFCVKGKVQEDEDKLSLRLRIGHTESGGAPKTVEFDFDLAADTAYSVANEMVSDLSLSHEDAKMIAKAIKEEILTLTEASTPHRRYVSIFSSDDDEQQQQQKGAAPMAVDMNGLSEGHLVAAAAAVLAEQPGQGPARSSLTQQDASPFQNGREYESSAQHPGQHSREEVFSDDGRHAPQQNGGATGKAASDVSMLSRSNSQGGDEDDEAGSLIGRKRSSSKLNPPKEEDRTLPLKKLFENLTGVSEANPEEGGPLSNGSTSSAFATSPVPKAASVAGDLPHMDLHISTCSVSEGASTQRLGPLERRSLSRVLSVSQDIDGMGAHRHSNGSSSQRVSPTRVMSPAPPDVAMSTTRSSPALSPAAFARNPWSSSSCLHTSSVSSNGMMATHQSQPCLMRPRNSRDDLELKELRRKEAAAAASEMESRSLLGLDRFGVAHGCAQNKKGGLLGSAVRK